jgi:hypothetical protein
MASANLDVVRSLYAEWERGDYSSVEWADPEIEFSWIEDPARRMWHGAPWSDSRLVDLRRG